MAEPAAQVATSDAELKKIQQNALATMGKDKKPTTPEPKPVEPQLSVDAPSDEKIKPPKEQTPKKVFVNPYHKSNRSILKTREYENRRYRSPAPYRARHSPRRRSPSPRLVPAPRRGQHAH